ncbi:hypothetical protein FPHYL_10214 [Fusarium phyllophilum]|uniref:Uncharacterized protein n=1 Tax=Fusarium phyllophilum TaxID=47803 RepID=A0A8H5J509_9HYPO|nr:hypothetical protein FPHYL_10214 [Fusarium phyllophilum]
MAAEKPFNQAGEMLSKESVEKPDMTDQVTKTLGTEAAQDGTKIVNGRRFTFRFRDSNGMLLPPNKHWTDEEGNSEGHDEEWWEKKSLLRDWIYGRMSPEEFDAHFPYYMGPPKEWYRINKEADAMPQEEKEPSGLKESDEHCTQRYANYYGDGSGLPLRPGMGPMTDEQKQDDVHGRMSSEEFDVHFPNYNGPKDCDRNKKEDVSDVRSSHTREFNENPFNEQDSRYDDDSWIEENCWNEEEAHGIANDHTPSMLRDEHYACLHGDDDDLPLQHSKEPSKSEKGFLEEPPEHKARKDHHFAEGEAEEWLEREDPNKPRYASYYGDGSGLPLRPGMGPPMTEEEYQESWKKSLEQFEIVWNMTDEEFYAQHPEYKAEELLEGDNDEVHPYASYYGDGSGLPLRPGMGPPLTEEEHEESLKKWRAEEDRIFNMSDEEFNAEFPERYDKSDCLCTEEEGLRLMEEYDEAYARRREAMIRKWKESSKSRPEDQL